jgi:hypothetical protein
VGFLVHRPSAPPRLAAVRSSVASAARRSMGTDEAAAALPGRRRPSRWPGRLHEVQRSGSVIATFDIVSSATTAEKRSAQYQRWHVRRDY